MIPPKITQLPPTPVDIKISEKSYHDCSLFVFVVWIGDKDKEATIVVGFFRDFNINVRGVCMSDATISVEGLV